VTLRTPKVTLGTARAGDVRNSQGDVRNGPARVTLGFRNGPARVTLGTARVTLGTARAQWYD
jgi:hypothetical protein